MASPLTGYQPDSFIKRINFTKVFFAIVIMVVLYLVLVPLVYLIWNSLHGAPSPLTPGPLTFDNYAKAYFDPELYAILLDTLIFAVASVAIGMTLGISFAWLLERTNVPLKTWLHALVPLPMVIPGMLLAMAWVLLLSPRIGLINLAFKAAFGLDEAPFDIYTMGGMAFVEGLRMVPTMFLMMVGAFRSMDPSLEEAGTTSGAGTLSTLRRVTGPLMMPAILSATIYMFTIGIEAFEVPGIIGLTAGIHVFSTKIYLASRDIPVNYSLAAAFAVLFVFVSVLLMVFYSRVTRRAERFTTITGKGYRPRVINLGRWRYAGAAFIGIYLFLTILLPALILLWASLLPFYSIPTPELVSRISLTAYRETFNYPKMLDAIRNSLVVMVSVATLSALLGAVVSWLVVRTRNRARSLLDMATFLPLGIPSIVIGLALLLVYLKFDFIPIYNTVWILIVAYVTRLMTFPVRTMNAAMHQLHQELEEAAWVSGASWWTTFTKVTIPLLMPAMVNVWIWTAMISLREVSAPLLLSGPHSTVISVVIWDRWQDGGIPQAAALGVMLLAFGAMVMIVGRVYGFKIGRRALQQQ